MGSTSSEPDNRESYRLTLIMSAVHFSVRPILGEIDQMRSTFNSDGRSKSLVISAHLATAVGWRMRRDHPTPGPCPAHHHRQRACVRPGTPDALTPHERSGIPLLRSWRRRAIHFRWCSDRIIAEGFQDHLDPHSWWSPPRKIELTPAVGPHSLPAA